MKLKSVDTKIRGYIRIIFLNQVRDQVYEQFEDQIRGYGRAPVYFQVSEQIIRDINAT